MRIDDCKLTQVRVCDAYKARNESIVISFAAAALEDEICVSMTVNSHRCVCVHAMRTKLEMRISS